MADGYLLDGDSIERLREDHRLLEQMVTPALRRRLITRPAGSIANGLMPYIITSTDGNTPAGNVAVFRTCGLESVTGKRALEGSPYTTTGDDVLLDYSAMHGVLFTGQLALVATINGSKRIVGGWTKESFVGAPTGFTVDTQTCNGVTTMLSNHYLVSLNYVDYEGTSQTADVAAYNQIDRTLYEDQVVYVLFMSDHGCGSGTTPGERFVIISADCPP